MKAGLACPYSLDGPGGVQEHIRDLTEALVGLVHGVSVISPAGDDELPPGHVVPAGQAVPVPLQRRGAVTTRLPGRSGC
jgi:phosphatidylinositol alpha-mannosyltransferase